MADKIQTRITDFSFPSTIDKLKLDPALYNGSILLHDFSHDAGVAETDGFDVYRLDKSQSQYIQLANSLSISASENFQISCKFFLNSLDTTVSLFGWDYNSGTHISIQPTGGSGSYGRLAFRMSGPQAFFPFTDEPIRPGQLYNLNVKRVSNIWTFELNGQAFDNDPVADATTLDNGFTLDYIGARSVEPPPGGGGTDILQDFLDGYIWDIKIAIASEVGTSANTLDLPGSGASPWINLGTGGASYNGITYNGPDSINPTAVTLDRETIGEYIKLDDDTILNLADTEATDLGISDTSIKILPTSHFDQSGGATVGRAFKLTNAISQDTKYQFNEAVSDYLVAASAAGRNYALSFWFKPELDVWDSTNIGYFFRWGTNTSVGSFNHWILLNGASNKKDIKLSPGGAFDYNTYENTNQGIINVIFTANGAWLNGTQVATYDTPVTLQDFNSGNEFSANFHLGTSQHSSDRNITYLYRLHFADIDESNVTEDQWIAKEYETGLNYIKAIKDSTN